MNIGCNELGNYWNVIFIQAPNFVVAQILILVISRYSAKSNSLILARWQGNSQSEAQSITCLVSLPIEAVPGLTTLNEGKEVSLAFTKDIGMLMSECPPLSQTTMMPMGCV